MGLCTPQEEAELEQLRRQYPEIDEAIRLFEQQLEKNMMLGAQVPSSETDQSILSKLESLNKVRNVPLNDRKHRPNVHLMKGNRWKAVAAASIIFLVVSIYYNYSHFQRNKLLESLVKAETKSPLPLADYEIIINPSITPVAMYGQGSHSICRCTMFWDKKKRKAYIIIHHLPMSKNSEAYQLWAEVNGKPVSVGIIDDSIRGRLIEVSNVPDGAMAFKVVLGKPEGEATPEDGDLFLMGRI